MAQLRQIRSLMQTMRDIARAHSDRRRFCHWHRERHGRRAA